MKLLIISKYALAREVGFESRLFAMSRLFVKKGHDVSIIASVDNYLGSFSNHATAYNKTYNHEVIEGIKATWIKSMPYTRTISIKRVLSWIDFEWKLLWMKKEVLNAPDVIIVSSVSLLTILNGIRLKRKFKCKLIFEIRDIWPLTLTAEGGYSASHPFVKLLAWIEKFGYRNADLVVGTMPNIAAHVNSVTGEQINCACVPFGVDLQSYAENVVTDSPVKDYGIPTDKFIIGYAGSIGLSNGLTTFVDVIKQFKDDPRVYFVLAGGGGLRETYMQSLEGCTNVQFIAKVERHEVKHILAKCDVLYFAALKSKVWEYGWSPNKLMDYMISGKPVLASYSGYPSMINEADSGIIVPSEDAVALINGIEKMIAMPPAALIAMGERGKQWIREHRQWETVADDYLLLMKEVLQP